MGGAVFAIGVSPGAFPNYWLDRVETSRRDYSENKYLQENKVKIWLFSANLERLQQKENALTYDALGQTKNYFSSTYPGCNVSNEDLSAVLFEANQEFREKLQREAPEYDTTQREEKTSKKKYVVACRKLSKCVIDQRNVNPNLSTHACNMLVNEIYTKIRDGLKENEKVWTANLWENKYLNGDISDSDYDLMYDISQIGKVLFESYKAPPEIIYYKAPLFNWQKGSSESSTENFSEAGKTEDNRDKEKKSENSRWNSDSLSSWWTGNWGNGIGKQARNPITEDEELNSFLSKRSPHTTVGNYDKPLFLNQCVAPAAENSKNPPQQTRGTGSPEEKQRSKKEQWAIDREQRELSKYWNPSWVPVPPPSGDTTSGSGVSTPPPSDQSQIQELKKSIEECSKKCEGLPRDEKQICVMQCACWDYISPALKKDDRQPVIKEGALIIRFCSVASSILIPNTSAKNIISIAEIFNEIGTSVNTLYNSGKLNVKKDKKEMLDSSSIKSDISKWVAFSATTEVKAPNPTISDSQKKNENQIVQSNLKASIYGIERNSFVLLDDYEEKKKNKSLVSSQKESTPASQSPNTQEPENEHEPEGPQILIKKNTIASTNLSIGNFIERNSDLLDRFEETIKSLNASTALLNSKKS